MRTHTKVLVLALTLGLALSMSASTELTTFAYDGPLPTSERIARTVLCLPLYDSLSDEDIQRVCGHIIE